MLFFNKKYIQLIETSIKIEKHKDKPLPFTSLTAGARSKAHVF